VFCSWTAPPHKWCQDIFIWKSFSCKNLCLCDSDRVKLGWIPFWSPPSLTSGPELLNPRMFAFLWQDDISGEAVPRPREPSPQTPSRK
jgi:hypothetical protein